MSFAIKAENISKAYQLGDIGTGTLHSDLKRWVAKMRGREDPFLTVGETNDRTTKGSSDVVWSLRDINFEIEQGDAVGIIGRNGAGKSTLLKLLSKVTGPTTGCITGRGRIASLLEVGTGFHPELTGRENIYLNGAIMGMRKKEIARKFDEIVSFAAVERYIDTPVKRYSSGMYVRLAFAIAAHLESEILIVDEVLAVGDAEFQKKCLGKMNDVSKGEGRTVLFVSHNMGNIMQLCKRAILLNNGTILANDLSSKVVESYLSSARTEGSNRYVCDESKKSQPYYFSQVLTVNQQEEETEQFGFGESVCLIMTIVAKETFSNVKIGFNLQNNFGVYISTSVEDFDYSIQIAKNTYQFIVTIPPSIIAPNSYSFRLAIFADNKIYDILENHCPIKINDTGTKLAKYEGVDYGSVILDYKWKQYHSTIKL